MIDLRSDVMSPTSPALWEAMTTARVGWMLAGEDESVNDLEAACARLLGHEAGLFLPTGNAANLVAMLTLGERGTQVILDDTSHIACAEAQSYAFICGLAARPLASAQGLMALDEIERALAASRGGYLPRTSLLCLENTHNNAGGAALDAHYLARVVDLTHRHGARVHLDGARLFNAAAALDVPLHALGAACDSVCVNLNKSLGAPYGAVLCGTQATIKAARQNAHRIGAHSVHKAGLFAAAGLVALEDWKLRAKQDNTRAALLAKRLEVCGTLDIARPDAPTNIVKIGLPETLRAQDFVVHLKAHGLLALARDERGVRFVTHAGVDDEAVERAARIARATLDELTAPENHIQTEKTRQ